LFLLFPSESGRTESCSTGLIGFETFFGLFFASSISLVNREISRVGFFSIVSLIFSTSPSLTILSKLASSQTFTSTGSDLNKGAVGVPGFSIFA